MVTLQGCTTWCFHTCSGNEHFANQRADDNRNLCSTPDITPRVQEHPGDSRLSGGFQDAARGYPDRSTTAGCKCPGMSFNSAVMIRIPASAAARACPARLSARCHVDRTLPASLASSTSFASGRFNTFPRRSLAQGHPRVRWASSSAYQPPTDLSTRSFAVIGAGTLGRRIALMWLTQGRAVHLL